MLNDYQMQPHVHSATHEHGNILDLVITHQRDNLVSNISVMDYAMSDHHCVECTLNVSIKPVKARFEQKRAVKHIQMGVFVNDIKVKNTHMRTEELSVDKMLDAYNSTLSITLNKHAPLKKTRVRTQPHPWYNEDIKDARLYRRVCEHVWRHTGLQCARITYNEARNLVNNLIKRTKIQYYRHKIEYADNKDMFGIVNSLIKPKTESLLYFVSTEEYCNEFADFFI